MALPESVIWGIATVGVVSVIGAGTYATSRVASRFNGDSTERNGERFGMYCLIGGALGGFLLPSLPVATVLERTALYGVAMFVGSLAGGSVGMAIEWYSNRRRKDR